MGNFTICIGLIFGLITFLTLFTFYKASGSCRQLLLMIAAWMIFQSLFSLSNLYKVSVLGFPGWMLLILPPLVFLIWLFVSPKGEKYLAAMDMHLLVVIHIVRAPAGLVIYWLYISKLVPHEMTFAGGNLDILSGVTAPIVYYFAMMRGNVKWKLLVIWNIASLLMLSNVIFRTISSGSATLLDHDSILFHFPFVYLSGVILPIIFCSHMVVIRNLLKTYVNGNQRTATEKSAIEEIILKRQILLKAEKV